VPGFEVARVMTSEQLRAALVIRTRVFVEEQHVPADEEIDAYDADPLGVAVHLLGSLDGVPVGTARLLLDPRPGELPHIGCVAVLAEHRRQGYGAALMHALHAEARACGFAGVTLAAQLHALAFYEPLGYFAHGPVFLDAGIEHRQMDLLL